YDADRDQISGRRRQPRLGRTEAVDIGRLKQIGYLGQDMRRNKVGHRAATPGTLEPNRLRSEASNKRLNHAGNQNKPTNPVLLQDGQQRADLEAVDDDDRASA